MVTSRITFVVSCDYCRDEVKIRSSDSIYTARQALDHVVKTRNWEGGACSTWDFCENCARKVNEEHQCKLVY